MRKAISDQQSAVKLTNCQIRALIPSMERTLAGAVMERLVLRVKRSKDGRIVEVRPEWVKVQPRAEARATRRAR